MRPHSADARRLPDLPASGVTSQRRRCAALAGRAGATLRAGLSLLVVLIFATGCATHSIRWSSLSLAAAADANANNPVAVDFVMSSDAAMSERIAGLTAAQWFAQRETLRALFPGRLDYVGWEVVPSQTLSVPRDRIGGQRRNAVLVFARYGTPGDHRARIARWSGPITVRLGRERIEVVTDR